MTVDSMDDLPEHLQRVARRIGEGDSYAEAGETLGLAKTTVRNYVRNLAVRLPPDPYSDMRPKTAVLVWYQNDVTTKTS